MKIQTLISTAALIFVVISASVPVAQANESSATIKVGVLATLTGPYTALGEDGVRGIEVAMQEFERRAGGKTIEIIVESTDASPDSALSAAAKLVNVDKVDIVIGPVSGSEGIAIRDFSKAHPGVTFINGSSAAQETTLITPSKNFFRFSTEGAQWSAGLGEYVYKTKGYRKVATIGDDYSFIYTQVFGFAAEFCELGGQITDRYWVPLGTEDFEGIITALPEDVDAIYLGLGGRDAVNFLKQYQEFGGNAKLIGGSIMVDGTVLSSKGNAKDALIGTPSSGPQADTWKNARWQEFIARYQNAFEPDERFASPSLFATSYYNAATAAFLVLNDIKGDLTDKHAALRKGLENLVLEAPNGTIKLDDNRQAIGSNFVVEVVKQTDGTLATELVLKKDSVDQQLGIPAERFANLGLPSRDNPVCESPMGGS